MSQTFTSAATSINKDKLPALYKKVDFGAGPVILDVGCGKYDNAKQYVEQEFDAQWFGYDKYNRTKAENERAVLCDPDCIICSNLLNVIDSEDEIQNIANFILHVSNTSLASYFVSVYDGDRSGVGRQTGPDQWQRNEKIQSYLRFFPNAVIRKGVITNNPDNVI